MEPKACASFKRVVSLVLSAAILLSMFVIPAGTAADAAVLLEPQSDDLRTKVSVSGANYYDSQTGVAMTYGSWLSTLYYDSNYSDTLENFVNSKTQVWTEKISLMPAKDAIAGNTADDLTDDIHIEYHDGGAFTLYDMGQQGYAHGWINCNLAIPGNAKTLCF